VVDVVPIVSTSVPEPPGTVDAASEHVAGLVGLEGVVVTAQVSPTVDVNAFTGATVIVAVLPEVAPTPKVIGPLLLSVKLGTPSTVTPTAVLPVTLPVAASLPVTVALYDPGVVDAVVVTITVQVAGLLAATGVTAQVRSTTPVNPYDGVTVTVPESPVAAPATKLSAPLLVSAIAGGGGAVTVAVTFVVELSLPVAASLPVTATV
jgi:hypothetical protein